MIEVHTRIRVDPDHRISGVAPADLPPGEHEVTITVAQQQLPQKRFRVTELPSHDTPWDDSVSLRREDMYDDDGR